MSKGNSGAIEILISDGETRICASQGAQQVNIMKIKVTQQNIDSAKRNDGRYCPVAMAIRDRLWFGKWRFVAVGYHRAHTIFAVYDLPAEASDFIRNFDMRIPVQPFEFEIA